MELIARDIEVSLGGRRILHGAGVSAAAGEITILVGPNGSGKTTMMRALTGDLGFAGIVTLNGRPLGDYRKSELACVRAVLEQETSLSFPFTVGEIVRLGLSASPLPRTAAERAEIVDEALDRVDLAGFAGRFYQELSGGERQRVQLARVLCQIWEPVDAEGAPRWLFLDEPVSSLDIRHQLTIMEIAQSHAAAGGGVVAIMHDLNLTAMYADRLAVMSGGRIAAEGEPAGVLDDALLADVFGCDLRVGAAPRSRLFVLPQSIRFSA
ncbi:MAG: heme ABC transporter ATP-binding protein [Flavobacteriaceae bacterium]